VSRPYPATPSTPTPSGNYYSTAQTDALLAASAATVSAALALKAPLITTVLSPSGGVDQTAINAAMTAASAAGGGEVVLVKGDWIISDSILPKSKVVLRGQGWGTRIQTTGGMTTPAIKVTSSVEWAVVKDLHIDGGSTTNPANTGVDGLYTG
jgi:hypothetical protein